MTKYFTLTRKSVELKIEGVSRTYPNGVQAELPAVEREHAVISTKLLAGRTVVHVCNTSAPGPGFELAEPDLEDVYFSTMAGQPGRRGERGEPALTL